MGPVFKSKFFSDNRAKLRKAFPGTAPILIPASSQLQRSSDEAYPFRQDSSFWYFTGINLPEVVLVIDKDKEYLVLPPKAKFADSDHIPQTNQDLFEISGIEEVLDNVAGWKKLGGRIKRVKHIAMPPIPPTYVNEFGFYTNPARANLAKQARSHNPDVEILNLSPHIAKLRSIKQDIELEAIKRGIHITSQTLTKVKRQIRSSKLKSENEVEGLILSEFRINNAWPAFGNVVASGGNACTIHYTDNSAPIRAGELVVVDVGARVYNYSSDLTRTIASSTPKKRQRQVHEAVLKSMSYIISLIKPGIVLRDLEAQALAFIGEQMRELGLIKTISDDNVHEFMPHLVSHHLGIDTHDAGPYDQPLQAGTVLAVEPGIYIPAEKIGVRVEDNILLTEHDNINLSSSLPTSLN